MSEKQRDSQDGESGEDVIARLSQHVGADDEERAGPSARSTRSLVGLLRERFAREFSAAATALVSRPVQVRSTTWRRRPYAEFLSTVHEPACCCILQPVGFSPSTASGSAATSSERFPAVWLEFSTPVAYALIESLLGGSREGAYIPDRSLTPVEQRLLRRVMSIAADCLTKIWPHAGAKDQGISFILQPSRGGPSGKPRKPASRPLLPVIVLRFDVTVASATDSMRLCIPQSLLEAATTPDERENAHGRGGLVELSAAAPEVTLSADELANLAPGDILATDLPADGEVIVRIAGIPKRQARLGRCDNRRAITITGPLDPDSP